MKFIGNKGGNLIFRGTGKQTNFKAIWNIDKQEYNVYKDGKWLITLFRVGMVKNYLGF